MGILNCVGFCMMVTIRSSSSELRSPALQKKGLAAGISRSDTGDAPLVEINIGLLADNVGIPPSNTLDLGQGVHDFSFTINVGVEETQDVL